MEERVGDTWKEKIVPVEFCPVPTTRGPTGSRGTGQIRLAMWVTARNFTFGATSGRSFNNFCSGPLRADSGSREFFLDSNRKGHASRAYHTDLSVFLSEISINTLSLWQRVTLSGCYGHENAKRERRGDENLHDTSANVCIVAGSNKSSSWSATRRFFFYLFLLLHSLAGRGLQTSMRHFGW